MSKESVTGRGWPSGQGSGDSRSGVPHTHPGLYSKSHGKLRGEFEQGYEG